MWATLHIGFYLTRDTFHRWCTRISSPLSRLAVVYCLSLCGLVFLSSYVISVKLLRLQIQSSGGNLIIATEITYNPVQRQAGHSLIPPNPNQYNLYVFNESFSSATVGTQQYSLVEYMPYDETLFPDTSQCSTFLLPTLPSQHIFPEKAVVEGYPLLTMSLPEQKSGILRRLFQSGALFIPANSPIDIWDHGFVRRYILEMKNCTAKAIQYQEETLMQISKLDKRNLSIVSNGKLLEKLDRQQKTQYRLRVWVTTGISAIICLLLTCISSLEFRHNSHIYALLGSFGVNRSLLYLCFLMENTLLVASGFAAALITLYHMRDYITTDLYKSQSICLSLRELSNDIRSFLLAFSICILVSSIPIGIAAIRPIGKILK